ncbi:MAG: [FeFe] hydrogenase, group A [Bacilli bacterium]|jgi:NADP-reducing hydrogenase subunit HndD|nr:[FeFe] hydrogenase, group A [Bacilli bacterium]
MSNKKVTIFIENKPYLVDDGQTILEAAKGCGYNIPNLCNWRDHDCSLASCRVCLVHVDGERRLIPSCAYPVRDGLHVSINDPAAVAARRTSVELLLSNHYYNCQSCRKNGHCELLEAAREVGARPEQYAGTRTQTTLDEIAPGIVRDSSKCILCGRCIEACKKAQGIGILGFEKRGFKTIVGPSANRSFANVPCIQCGQCTLVCPTGALMERNSLPELDEAFAAGKTVIAIVAPAVRTSIGEEFGDKIGTNSTGKLAACLHRLGFAKVFDNNFGADLTIMEEANEFVRRFSSNSANPMLTSCCPGWINYIELNYPELVPHLSSCKSPQQMMGAILKSYYAEKTGIDRSKIAVVSIVPCTAKKFERKRPEMKTDELEDIDVVLTTRELGQLVRRSGIIWNRLPKEDFDHDLIGENSGAGVIFGVTGGVMEAAVRTAYHILTGAEMEPITFTPCRGLDKVKEATLSINGTTIKIAMVSGMVNAKPLLEDMKNGTSPYNFVEVMACPGGCINGGGQPYVFPVFLPNEEPDIWYTYSEKRAKVLYDEDAGKPIRRSHLNPDVQKLYKDFLGTPGSAKAEHLLHTTYNTKRIGYPDPTPETTPVVKGK